MTRPGRGLPALLITTALAWAFSGLIAHPRWWIVDGERPTVDANRPPSTANLIGNDFTAYFAPRLLWTSASLRRNGHLPLWDPTGFGGRPLAGNPQSGLWYPPSWPVRAWGEPWMIAWLTVLHLSVAAGGAYRLARDLGQQSPGATISAGAFSLSPILIAHIAEGHHPHVWAVCWYPWAVLSARGLWKGRAVDAAFLSAFVALAMTTGHPQEGALLVIGLGALGAFCASRGRSAWPRRAELAGLALALAAGLSAVDWLPSRLAAPLAAHGGPSTLEASSRYDWDSPQLVQLFSPRALGDATGYEGPGNLWESLLSFGFLPLCLAIAATRERPRRAEVVTCLSMALLSIALAAGPKLGLYTIAHTLIPGFSSSRTPGRFLFLGALAVALLAGFGADAARRQLVEGRPGPRATAVIITLLLLVLLSVTESGLPSRAAKRILLDPAFGLACAAMLAASMAARGRWTSPDGIAWGLVIGSLAELALHGSNLLPIADPRPFTTPDSLAIAVSEAVRAQPGRVRATDSVHGDLAAARDGVRKANTGDLFQLRTTGTLVDPVLSIFSRRPRLVSTEHRQAALDRLGVSVLASDRDEPGMAWKRLSVAPTGVVQQNPTALPLAYVVPRAIVGTTTDRDALATLAAIDPRSAVLVDEDPMADVPGPRQRFLPARLDDADPDRPRVRVKTSAPGLLVVLDAWAPGWSAAVDGVPAPLLRGDHTWRVVPLKSPGEHVVSFEYRAPGLVAGRWISIATLAAVLAILAASRWKSRARAGALAASRHDSTVTAASTP